MNTPSFDRQQWSTRGFTTVDPERQGMLVGMARPRAESLALDKRSPLPRTPASERAAAIPSRSPLRQ